MNPGVYAQDVPSPGLKPYTPSRRKGSPRRGGSPKNKAKMYQEAYAEIDENKLKANPFLTMTYPYYGRHHWGHWGHPLHAGLHHHPYWHGGYGGYGYGHPYGYGHHFGYGYPGMYARHFGHPFHFQANWGYDYNYYPNPDLLPKDEEEFRKNMPKYEIPLVYSPGRFSKINTSPQRGSPRSMNSPSPQRKAIIDR